MSKARPLKPIESFSPELFRALIEGAKREITFDLPYRKAVHLRMRLNQLRNLMRLQKHEHAAMVSQAVVTISWPDDTPVNKSSRNVKTPKDINTICMVKIAPSDSEYSAVLKAAGVTVPSLSSEPVSSKVEDDILSSYLKEKGL